MSRRLRCPHGRRGGTGHAAATATPRTGSDGDVSAALAVWRTVPTGDPTDPRGVLFTVMSMPISPELAGSPPQAQLQPPRSKGVRALRINFSAAHARRAVLALTAAAGLAVAGLGAAVPANAASTARTHHQ